MQLKIEINTASLDTQECVLCNQAFEMTDARVIACNDKNHEYGDVCPDCISKGSYWVQRQLWMNLSASMPLQTI